MPLHDTHYQHWDGVHLGLWSRRWAIARNGLTACLRNKWLRHVVVLCWGAALVMTALIFIVGQLLVADSIVVQWVGNFNPGLQSFARFLTTWLEQHPEISVRALQNVMFYFYCTLLLRVSIFVLGMVLDQFFAKYVSLNSFTETLIKSRPRPTVPVFFV